MASLPQQFRNVAAGSLLLTALILVLLYVPWHRVLGSGADKPAPSPETLLTELQSHLRHAPSANAGAVPLDGGRRLYLGPDALPAELRPELNALGDGHHLVQGDGGWLPVATQLLPDGETRAWLVAYPRSSIAWWRRYGLLLLLIPIALLLWALLRHTNQAPVDPATRELELHQLALEEIRRELKEPPPQPPPGLPAPEPAAANSGPAHPFDRVQQALRNAEHYIEAVGSMAAAAAPLPRPALSLEDLLREALADAPGSPRIEADRPGTLRLPAPAARLALRRLLTPGIDLRHATVRIGADRVLAAYRAEAVDPERRRMPNAVVRALCERHGWTYGRERDGDTETASIAFR